MPDETLSLLQEAIQHLLYMSESDAPFEVVHWENGRGPLDRKQVLALTGYEENTPIKEITLHDFFKDLIQKKSWYGEIERETMRQYQRLFAVIQQRLTDVKVFFLGKVRVEIYIVGRSADGDWVGVKTTAIET